MLSTIKSRFTSEPQIQASALPALLAAWPAETAPPRFLGKPKKDPPVDDWLAKVAEACVATGIPQKLWHEVARHFMSDDARRRVEEVEKVMQTAFGHTWGWKWSSFSVALKNIAGNLDRKKTEAVKVQHKFDSWWIIGRGGIKGTEVKTKEPLPTQSFLAKLASKTVTQTANAPPPESISKSKKETPSKAKDCKGSPPKSKNQKSPVPNPKDKQGNASKSKLLQTQPTTSSTTATATAAKASKTAPPPTESLASRVAVTLRLRDPPPPPPTTLVAQVPVWLLAASEAIFAMTPDSSGAMSILAAVLITVGSIPALPGVAAGSTATALGAAAVGLGTILRERAIAAADNQDK